MAAAEPGNNRESPRVPATGWKAPEAAFSRSTQRSLAGAPKLGSVTNPHLFETRRRSPQPELFALQDALGDADWLMKALASDGYAGRSRGGPETP